MSSTEAATSNTPDPFSRNIAISIGLHVFIVLLIFFRAVTMPGEPLNIRDAIRVDIVDLPKKMDTLPEKAEEKPAAVPKETKKEPPKKAEAKPVKTKAPELPAPKTKKPDTEKSQKRALEKLKAQDALEKIKKEVSKEKSVKPKTDVVAGNKVNAGNALSGLEKIDFDRYFDEIETKIHGAWSIPQWLADADFKAQVLVLIDERGFVIRKTFRKTSGNDIFDAKVMEAIDNSSPFTPPPQRLRGVLATSGIVVNFPQ
jgi:outer membrane biosynthesis protein TonB